MKGDPMDLRLDIERRKKYCSHERHNQDRERDMGDSQDSNRERSMERFSKFHERSKYVHLPCTLQCFKLSTNTVC